MPYRSSRDRPADAGRIVEVEPLSAEAFAPFGDVVTADDSGRPANHGTAARHDHLARLECKIPGATPNLALFDVRGENLPLRLRGLERHPGTTQAFIPMTAARYLVVVCPDDGAGRPDAGALRAFAAPGDVAINYRAGAWHHPLIALDADARFAMLAWEDGTAADTETADLPAPVTVAE